MKPAPDKLEVNSHCLPLGNIHGLIAEPPLALQEEPPLNSRAGLIIKVKNNL